MVAVVEVIGTGCGDLPLPRRLRACPDCVQASGIRVRQRLEQNVLHHAKDRSICTDPEREGQDSDESEPRRFAKLAKSELEVVHIILFATPRLDRHGWLV